MKVAVIGGSITEGAGASQYKKSYVYKLEKYFKEKYENTIFKNLGAGGTASQFGIFRLKRDLGDFNPDIIFIEFAVNDRIYNSSDASIYFEGLIRQCLKYTDRIVIIDCPTGMADSCTSIHKKIAYFYNIPVIDVQDEVWKRIGSREFGWQDIAVDNLHPNDKGHEIYCEIIKKHLDKIDFESIKANNDEMKLMNYEFVNPMICPYDGDSVEFYGHWREEELNLNNKMKNAAVTSIVGDGIVFKFRGKCLSMMDYFTRKSGIIECQLDNMIFSVDLYMDNDGYFNTTLNIKDLPDIEHTLVIKVSDKKNQQSLGNDITIGGFLIDSGCDE